jgi:hypothetical protein
MMGINTTPPPIYKQGWNRLLTITYYPRNNSIDPIPIYIIIIIYNINNILKIINNAHMAHGVNPTTPTNLCTAGNKVAFR